MTHACILVADKRDIYTVLDEYANYDDGKDRKNPMFDYFSIGGKFDGTLKLKEPRKIKRFFGLITVGNAINVNVALKSEIVQEALLENPPNMLFYNGKLHISRVEYSDNPIEEEKWKKKFRESFEKIPDNELLQIVDAHS